MKVISLHVDDEAYSELKAVASRRGRPAAELVREAMSAYLGQENSQAPSVLSLPVHDSGRLLAPWTREELLDEMRAR
ncbi:MAG: ribbon-helix-helix protein, CopG family [Acidobacteriota bacterium]